MWSRMYQVHTPRCWSAGWGQVLQGWPLWGEAEAAPCQIQPVPVNSSEPPEGTAQSPSWADGTAGKAHSSKVKTLHSSCGREEREKNLREQALQIPKWEKNVEEEMLQVCGHRLPCNLRWDHTDLTWRTVFPGRDPILEQGRKVRRDKGEQLQADHNSHSPSPYASWEGCQWRCEVEPREKGGRLKVLF